MDNNVIRIKNMVCPRCIMTVSKIFRDNGIIPVSVTLGTVTLSGPVPEDIFEIVRGELEECGFAILEDRKLQLYELIRTGVIEYVRTPSVMQDTVLSEYLQEKCRREYSALSKLFTEVRGISIERYAIAQKIEYIKELLTYGELSVSEIAWKLNYSSVAHLSSQFKTETGMSPTAFRKNTGNKRKSLDEI